jgi:hypothetical protein
MRDPRFNDSPREIAVFILFFVIVGPILIAFELAGLASRNRWMLIPFYCTVFILPMLVLVEKCL